MPIRLTAAVIWLALLLVAAPATLAGGPTAQAMPARPVIIEPAAHGQIVHPADVHMETAPFFDADGSQHMCTTWQILVERTRRLVWQDHCDTVNKVHVHLGDGAFVGHYTGRTELKPDKKYILRVRHAQPRGSGKLWSLWRGRKFTTSPAPPPGTSTSWTMRQSGFVVEVVAGGLQLPVNLAFLPSPGPNPSDPLLYVTELPGTIKTIARDGTVTDYFSGILNYAPPLSFPGSGEQGLTGLVVEPVSGDVFASMLYQASDGFRYPRIQRFHSAHDGAVAESTTVVLEMPGDPMGASHQISHLSIGPDSKLYVHLGDGLDITTGQDLTSFSGKILRMNLDGGAPADNPFYDATNGITATDYVFAYGFRNPFGGAWRAADDSLYMVENGPNTDRFARVVPGRNYLWDGTDASMTQFALHTWTPSSAPVSLAFVETETFGGSGFPADEIGHAFISESGPTFAGGPAGRGKRISEFVLDANGALVSGPSPLVEYTGTGKSTVGGLALGPDGLYFTDLYKEFGATSPQDRGAQLLRIRWVGP